MRDFVAIGDVMYFSAITPESGRELWKTDGTSAELVKDIAPDSASANVRGLIDLNGTLLFRRRTAQSQLCGDRMARPRELFAWKPAQRIALNSKAIYHDRLYFSVWNSSDGIDLWTTDSTDAGTYRVADLIFPRPPVWTIRIRRGE